MKRFSLLVSLGLLAGQAFGSFELLMQIDRDVSGAPAIRRFDPVSGAYLGAFGQGYLANPTAMVFRNGVLHVLDNRGTGAGAGRVLRFNPYTGEPLSMVALSTTWGKVGIASGLDLTPNGNYLVSDSQVSGNSTYVNEYLADGSYLFGRVWASSAGGITRGIALNSASNKIYSARGAFVDVFDSTTGSTSAVQSIAAPGAALFVSIIGNYLYYSADALTEQVYRALIKSDGTLDAFSAIDPSPVASSNTLGVGHGHSPFAYATQRNFAGTWSFSRFNSVTGDSLGSFGSGVMISPWGNIEVIAAPEPGTMLALGAGLAVLLRNSRRSKG